VPDLAPFEISEELYERLAMIGGQRGVDADEAARDLLIRALTERCNIPAQAVVEE
jgi:hypothetical protein